MLVEFVYELLYGEHEDTELLEALGRFAEVMEQLGVCEYVLGKAHLM